MHFFVTAVVLGVLVGAIYGLFSIGLGLSFGVLRMVNFAYGDFIAVAMYIAAEIILATHVSLYVAIPLVALSFIPIGYFTYVVFFRGTGRRAEHDQLVISLGLSLLLETILTNVFGTQPYALYPTSIPSVHLSWLYLPRPQLIAGLIALVLTVGIDLYLRRSRIGRAVRAVVADREVATTLGIDDRKVFTGAFVASMVVAGIAGAAMYGYLPVTPDVGVNFVLLGFIIVVLGGIGDLRGAFLAGICVGLAETLTASYWSTNVQDIVPYALFIVGATMLPRGVLGKAVA